MVDRDGVMRRGLTAKGHKGAFWGGENVLYLDCDDGDYKTMYIYPNS